MKKIIYILPLLIILIPFKISAAELDSHVDWNLDKSVFAHQYRQGQDHITNLAMITTNGITSYCIEPGVTAQKDAYYSSTTDINDTKLKNINVKKLSLIGYYGYGYEGHNKKEYYMASQELIWREMGVSNVWWTDAKEGGNIIDIELYKNEIINLVNSYEMAPKFNFKSKYMVKDEVIIDDINKVIKDYEVVGNNDVNVIDNKIKILVKENNNSFILRRKQNGKTTKFYYKEGYQTIGSFEFPYNYEKEYNINHTFGKIIINKVDYDTKSNIPSSKYASLKDAIYAIYDENDNMIISKKTDKNGKIVFDNLVKGRYTIKELTPSKGYTKSIVITRTYVGTGTLSVTIKSEEKIIKNKILIIKMLDDKENSICIRESNIKFNIYDIDGNLIKELETNLNGEIVLELPYGKYILKQMSSPDGIDKVEDKIINVEENNKVQNIVLVNHKLKKTNIIQEEILPKTGDNTIFYSSLFIILSVIGILYEKKYI